MSTKRKTAYEEVDQSSTVSIDRKAGVIRNVLIVGRKSRNKRRYTDEAMEQAIKDRMYENLQVYIGPHRKKGTPEFKKRSPHDHAGELRNTRKTADGVRGDLHYNRASRGGQVVLEIAERFPKAFGLSHHVDYEGYEEKGETLVTRILEAHVVDVVKDPGTTSGIYEEHDVNEETKVATEEEGEVETATPTEPTGSASWMGTFKDLMGAIHGDDSIEDPVKLKAIKKLMDVKKMLSGEGDGEEDDEEEDTEADKPEGEEAVDLKALVKRIAVLEKKPAEKKPKSSARQVATEEVTPKPPAKKQYPKKPEDVLAAYDDDDA